MYSPCSICIRIDSPTIDSSQLEISLTWARGVHKIGHLPFNSGQEATDNQSLHWSHARTARRANMKVSETGAEQSGH